MPPRQRTHRKGCLHRRHDFRHFGHAARPEFTASHVALIRADNRDAVALQRRQVTLCRRVGPHAHVHRRRDQHRRIRGQQQGRGQIIGATLGHLCHQIGGCGGDDDQIGRA